ncbi:MAG: molybdopterin cofactor-binding domain-containing protein, partial [Chloroflexota bacterium]
GGIIMGIGYTLYEDWQLDTATGHIITKSLEDCRITGIGDVPEMQIEFMEHGFDHSQSGGVGVGEASMVPVAASIASAIKHATGWQPTELPIRPQHIIEAMAELEGRK